MKPQINEDKTTRKRRGRGGGGSFVKLKTNKKFRCQVFACKNSIFLASVEQITVLLIMIISRYGVSRLCGNYFDG